MRDRMRVRLSIQGRRRQTYRQAQGGMAAAGMAEIIDVARRVLIACR